MQVRRLASGEWERFRAVRLRALADAPEAFGSTLAEESAFTEADWRLRLESPERAVFVVDGPEGPADSRDAVALASGGPAQGYPGIGALYGMWVAPPMRGHGLGMALIDAVKAWAIEAGYPVLGLGVTTMNAPAIALYERAGFVDRGERYPLRKDSDAMIQIMAMPLS